VERRLPLAGWLLAASVLAALGSGFFQLSPRAAGLLQLAAAALLFHRVSPRVRVLSLLLAVAGGLALLATAADLAAILDAFCKNQAMIAMLAAVGSLRLVPLPANAAALSEGRRAIWQTLFGVHWFGSIANLSAVVLFGDRMASAASRLEPSQAMVLARGFGLAALWSPFFVAMGVALAEAPGARLAPVLLWGLPLSQLLMALMAWQMQRSLLTGQLCFSGYPFSPSTLGGPLLLAVTVLVAHLLAPALSIVSLVSLAAPAYACLVGRRLEPLGRLAEYIRRDLPRMGPEVLLFLGAGILGSGITALVQHYALSFATTTSGPLSAALGLAMITLLASAGIHPIVGITAVGSVLAHIGIRPDLLALSFLMGWGLGVIISPISGTNLLLAGRYQIPVARVWRGNAVFVGSAYLICCGWLLLFDFFA
jgi:hypothetical protein